MKNENNEKNSEIKLNDMPDDETLKHVLDDITTDLEKELEGLKIDTPESGRVEKKEVKEIKKEVSSRAVKKAEPAEVLEIKAVNEKTAKTPKKPEPKKETAKPVKKDRSSEDAVIKESILAEQAKMKEAIREVKTEYAPDFDDMDRSPLPPDDDSGKKKKKKKNRRPKGRKITFFFALLMSVILFLGICGVGFAGYVAYKLTRNMPEFEPMALESADSSIIYDANGNQVIELGMYLRENIEYDQLPECLVDAFVAVEDSRYFEHNGFDIPRFTKAIMENLRTRSFGQGGSTITMQLIKNSYFQIDDGENSTMADREGMSGVQRKLQEIVLSMIADREMSKEELLVLFLNKVNFGDNIRGVQKAAEYYFGKDAKDLNINESAFLAGLINSPNSCNPYNELYKNLDGYIYLSPNVEYLENANTRKNEVLDLMYLHGYITESELNYNKSVRVEDLLTGKHEKFASTNLEFQSYIDAVIDEVIEVTGYSPYTKAMDIYTAMDPYMQGFVFNMQNNPEMFEDKYRFRNDLQQNALVILNNQTGELVALGGGRYQEDKAQQFNRATESYINPGSSIKPILEYALAFDKLGYSTAHTVTDKPIFLYETDILVSNAYGQGYSGDMLITEALARSLNTPAIQLLEEVIDKVGEDEVIAYLNSIGFDYANKSTFDLQWAIGGNQCLVTPVQLAGAHAVLMNNGKYIKPHTLTRVEYRGKYNTIEDYVADTAGTQALSADAAYMTATLENYNVTSGWISQLNLLKRKYPTFAKTGTTNFSEYAYENYDIPETAAKDQWLMVQTSNYTCVVWNGFDKLEDGAYFTVNDENYNLKCKLGSILLDELESHFQYEPHELERPSTVEDITFVRGTFPYVESGGSTVKGMISASSEYKKLISMSEFRQNYMTTVKGHFMGMSGSVNYEEGLMTIHWGGFGGYAGEGMMDISATSISGEKTQIAFGRCYFDRFRYVNPDMFYATITSAEGNSWEVQSEASTNVTELQGSGPYQVCGWTSYGESPICETIQ